MVITQGDDFFVIEQSAGAKTGFYFKGDKISRVVGSRFRHHSSKICSATFDFCDRSQVDTILSIVIFKRRISKAGKQILVNSIRIMSIYPVCHASRYSFSRRIDLHHAEFKFVGNVLSHQRVRIMHSEFQLDSTSHILTIRITFGSIHQAGGARRIGTESTPGRFGDNISPVVDSYHFKMADQVCGITQSVRRREIDHCVLLSCPNCSIRSGIVQWNAFIGTGQIMICPTFSGIPQ